MKKIPVVFAADENYMKYCSVALQSIIEHKVENELYYVYILCCSISDEVKQKMFNMASASVIIKFLDVEGKLEEELLFVDGHVTRETYFRILIPELLPQWDKVIYLDLDLICNVNISSLLEIEMGKNLIAGVITVGNENRKDYAQKYLKIPYETYINAGVLIFNNAEISKRFKNGFKEACYKFLEDKKVLKWHDQDLLNVVCYPDIYYLDSRWNTTLLRLMSMRSKKLEEISKSDVEECFILHFASNKPWEQSLQQVYLSFWDNASKTPFLEDIMVAYQRIEDVNISFRSLCKTGKISFSFLGRCFWDSVLSRIMYLVLRVKKRWI